MPQNQTQTLETRERGESKNTLAGWLDFLIIGFGGISLVARTIDIDPKTIQAGLKEIAVPKSAVPTDRIRQTGGGRKKLESQDIKLQTSLLGLVEPASRGDPEISLRWSINSTRTLAKQLQKQNHPVSHTKVSQLLKTNGFSMQANQKTREGLSHPDRDLQFHHINNTAGAYLKAGNPVISVDTKKKELIGNYKNNGQTWLPKGKPTEVNTHDFPDKTLGKAAPYGIYDIGKNQGYVNVGITHDTSEFAVASIARWYQQMEQNWTQTVLIYQYQLERAAANQLRGDRQADWLYKNPNRT